jgi:MSHA pilin protein MshD
MRANRSRSRHGFTLIEVIVAIVIVGIALASVMSVFVVTTQHSADPMARVQAQLAAEAYLDEILLKNFYDTTTNKVCPAGAGSHANYVCGYNGLSEAVPGLTGYTVSVAVTRSGVTLGSLDNVSVTRVLRIDVTVSDPNSNTITLTGFRTNYECNVSTDAACVPAT